MALTKTGTDGIKDDAVTLDKFAHGTSGQDGKFLRANNGAAPSFETVSIPAGTTINNNADNRVITGSDTTNTLNGESNVIIDGSGNVGIGMATVGAALDVNGASGDTLRLSNGSAAAAYKIGRNSTDGKLEFRGTQSGDEVYSFGGVNGERLRINSNGKLTITSTETANSNPVVLNASGQAYYQVITPNNTIGGIKFGDTDDDDVGAIKYGHGDNSMRFDVDGSERMRIGSTGMVGIGNTNPDRHLKIINFSTSGSSQGLELGEVGIRSSVTATSNSFHLRFYNPNGLVGNIKTASSATSFNTSSDYRLKENVVSITDGITRIKQLKPSKFNWILDKTNTPVDGFLAHEVSSVVPESITGTKDAVATQEDVDEVLAEKVGDPVYQQIDQSKLVPLLTAALQEAIAKIETLETKVAALEAK